MPLPRLLLVVLCAFSGLGTRANVANSAVDPIVGIWSGHVTSPQGETAELALEFFHRDDASGPLAFKFHFPAMFTHGASLGIPVVVEGDRYTIKPALDLALARQDDRLVGTFAPGKLPLTLRRGAPLPPPLPVSSDPPGPAPLWRYPLGAATWAPPTVSEETIYVGGGDGRFHAVDPANGRERWTWSGPHPIDGQAACDAHHVYFVDTKFNLVALDRHRGGLRWRVPLHNEFFAGGSVPDNPTFNHRAATPLVHDGVVYVGSSDGGIYALAAESGSKLWRHEAHAPVYSGIGLHGDRTLLFGTMDGSVVLVDLQTRRETLRVKTGGGVVTTPVVAENRVIAGSRDYELHAFNLADGSLAWRHSYWFSWIESTPALRDGLLRNRRNTVAPWLSSWPKSSRLCR